MVLLAEPIARETKIIVCRPTCASHFPERQILIPVFARGTLLETRGCDFVEKIGVHFHFCLGYETRETESMSLGSVVKFNVDWITYQQRPALGLGAVALDLRQRSSLCICERCVCHQMNYLLQC